MHFAGDLPLFDTLISRFSTEMDGRHSTVGVQHQMVNRRTQQLEPAEHHQGYSQPNQQQGYSQLNQQQGYSQPGMPPQGQPQRIFSEPNQASCPAINPDQTGVKPDKEQTTTAVKVDKHGRIVHKTVNYVSKTKHLYTFYDKDSKSLFSSS